jgi:hypothetical protein
MQAFFVYLAYLPSSDVSRSGEAPKNFLQKDCVNTTSYLQFLNVASIKISCDFFRSAPNICLSRSQFMATAAAALLESRI